MNEMSNLDINSYETLSQNIEDRLGSKLNDLKSEIKIDNYKSVLVNNLDSLDPNRPFKDNENVDELRSFLAIDMIGNTYKKSIIEGVSNDNADGFNGIINDLNNIAGINDFDSFVDKTYNENPNGDKKNILEWLKSHKDTKLYKDLKEEYKTIKKDVKNIMEDMLLDYETEIKSLQREIIGSQNVEAQEQESLGNQTDGTQSPNTSTGVFGLFMMSIAGKIGFFRGDGGFFSRAWSGIKHAGLAGLGYLGINKFNSTDLGKDLGQFLSNKTKNITSWFGGLFGQEVKASQTQVENSDLENIQQDSKDESIIEKINGLFSESFKKESVFDSELQSFIISREDNKKDIFEFSLNTESNEDKVKINNIETNQDQVVINYYTKNEKYPLDTQKDIQKLTLSKDRFDNDILNPYLKGDKNNYEININNSNGESLNLSIEAQTVDSISEDLEYGQKQLDEVLYSSREKLDVPERSNITSLSDDVNNMSHQVKSKLGSGKSPETLGDIDLDNVGKVDKGFLALLNHSKDYKTIDKLLDNKWTENLRDNIHKFADIVATFLIERNDTFLIGGILDWMGSGIQELKDMIDSGEDKAQERIAKKLEDKIKNSEDAKDKIQNLSEQFRFLRFTFEEQKKLIRETDSLNEPQKSRKIQELKKKKLSDGFENIKLSNKTKFELGASGEVQNLIEEFNNSQSATEKANRGYGDKDMYFNYERSELRSYDKTTVIKITHNSMYEVGKNSGVYVDSIKQAVWLANLTNKLDKMGNDHRHDGIDGRIRLEWDFKLTWKVKEIIERQHVMVYSSTLDEKVPSLDKAGWDKYIEFLNERT